MIPILPSVHLRYSSETFPAMLITFSPDCLHQVWTPQATRKVFRRFLSWSTKVYFSIFVKLFSSQESYIKLLDVITTWSLCAQLELLGGSSRSSGPDNQEVNPEAGIFVWCLRWAIFPWTEWSPSLGIQTMIRSCFSHFCFSNISRN